MSKPRTRYTLNEKVGDPKEWLYSWEIRDDVTLASTCDFCGQGEQRLTYEVTRGDETMWICQRCVGRYPVGGVLDGMMLDPVEARVQIHGLTARQKQKTCQEIIKKVQAAVPEPALSEIVVYFERNLQLSPMWAAVLFRDLPRIDEPVDVRIFEIQTRSVAHQDEFGALEEKDRLLVWPALSTIQKRRLASRGYAPASAMVRRSRGATARETEIKLTGSCMPALTETAGLHLTKKISVKSIR